MRRKVVKILRYTYNNMAESVSSMLERVSRELLNRCSPDIRGIIISRDDGLLIHTSIAYEIQASPHTIAAMFSAFMGPSRRVYRSLMNSRLEEAILSGSEGKLIVRSIPLDDIPGGRRIYVGILTSKNPNIGLILLELDRYIEAVRKILVRR